MASAPRRAARPAPEVAARTAPSERDGVRGAFLDPAARLSRSGAGDLGPGDGPAAWLEAVFDARPVEWLRRVAGRETFAWPEPPGSASSGARALVVKRYRGDEARDRWYERLRGRRPRSPGRREGENLAALAALGIPVPAPVAWVEDAGGERSAVLMRRLAAGPHLRAILAGAGTAAPPPTPVRRALGRELAVLTARLHEAGWYHRDLYLVHVVPAPELHLIDVARARREARPRRRWFVKDLAALAASAPHTVGAAERLRFLRDYLRARRAGGADPAAARAELRAWARAVAARARRIERHAPRRVDPRDGARRYGPG